ncbi:hypothetical protein MINT15_36130 [Saccharomonospora viridis]|uniref:Uncharacterized protein n=1 Tax=Saccharomonospora viridis TaxID=1852 RepID=A0A837D9Y7_9PSEU|nr:hypothetical protein MINT15_36130 [Saccharomonospora viridis]
MGLFSIDTLPRVMALMSKCPHVGDDHRVRSDHVTDVLAPTGPEIIVSCRRGYRTPASPP